MTAQSAASAMRPSSSKISKAKSSSGKLPAIASATSKPATSATNVPPAIPEVRRLAPCASLEPIAGNALHPQAAAESEEDDTESSGDETDKSSDLDIPVPGEFDDGTEWGKYTTVFDDDMDPDKMEVVDLDGPQTDVVHVCRFTDAQVLQMTDFFRALKVSATTIAERLQCVDWLTHSVSGVLVCVCVCVCDSRK
jgi:hypothetical protein